MILTRRALALGNHSADLRVFGTQQTPQSSFVPIQASAQNLCKTLKNHESNTANLGSLKSPLLSLREIRSILWQSSRILSESKNSKTSLHNLTPPPAPPLKKGMGELFFDLRDSRESQNFFAYFFSKKVSGRQPKRNNKTSPSLWEGARGWVIPRNPKNSRESNEIFRLIPQNNKVLDSHELQILGKPKSPLFLAQTDTTAGFLCKDSARIICAKQSPSDKAILRESCDIAHIKRVSKIPKILQKHIRRANRTTFIFPNGKSFRVARESRHYDFLKLFGLLYSSSANLNGAEFNRKFAESNAEIIALDSRGIFSANPSRIFKVKKYKLKRVR